MCYAIPGKVTALSGRLAVIDYFGEKKKAVNELVEVKVGDHVYAQGGYVIQGVPETEALATLAVWRETFHELQARDLELARLDSSQAGADKDYLRMLDKALAGKTLSRPELLRLLAAAEGAEQELLFKTANYLRQKEMRNSCCVHGVIEISNNCRQGCQYCGISSRNKDLVRYRMSRAEILASAGEAVEKHGFKSLVLQGGEDPGSSAAELAEIVREIKRKHQVLIFISFGEIGLDGLARLYEAGARGLLLRFETSNPELYRTLRPGCRLETRLEHIQEARRLGYLIITGALVGLPGQGSEDLLNDILLTRELKAEMYSFGPFIPHPQTPLAQLSPVRNSERAREMLKVLAVARITDPREARITVTTAFETLYPKAVEAGLMAGANSVMLIATPLRYRKSYDIYPDRAHAGQAIEEQISQAVNLLRDLGRAPTDLGIG